MKPITDLPDRFGPIDHVEVTGSTNADLLAAAAQGASSGMVLVADHQTAGRGRQNRQWVNEPRASLLVSVLLRPAPEVMPLVTIIAGLAVVDAVGELANRGPDNDLVGLKWPNDVLVPGLGDRKLAGILAESNIVGSGSDAVSTVVLGTGMNLRPLPQVELTANAASLSEVLGPETAFEREQVLSKYLIALDRRLDQAETGGHNSVLASYRSRCLTLGRNVEFVTSTGTVQGEAVQIADDGALVLETAAGRETLRAGDAHHVPKL